MAFSQQQIDEIELLLMIRQHRANLQQAEFDYKALKAGQSAG